MTVSTLIATTAASRGDAVALLAADKPAISYAQLAAHLSELAGQLAALGIRRGDRVAIVLPNGPEMAVSFLAVASVATAAPLNPGYRAPEFDFFLADLNAKAIIVTEQADNPAVAVARSRGIAVIRAIPIDHAPAGVMRYVCDDPIAVNELLPQPTEPDDVAMVLHTSGTTARPKIVPLSQANVCASATNISRWLSLTASDTCLNVMPLFHIHGLIAALLASLAAGASVVCSEGFNATKVLPWLKQFHPTWYTAVPTMHQAILAKAEAYGDVRSIAPLRFIRSSSAALPPTVAEGLEKAFGVPVIEAYGMTEAAHQMCCNPVSATGRKLGSVGLPAGPEVAIMNSVGNLLANGESGEVVIRGRNVTAGYDNNPEANATAFTNGWFRTGDIGYFDPDGYLFLSGRSKEIINRGGEKISPREIDEVLLTHPAIANAVAFAMPDLKLGEEIGVAIVLKPGQSATEYDILSFAASKLSDFKVPRRIVILDDIPKGPTGKVQRVGLAKKLGMTGAQEQMGEKRHVEPKTDNEKRLTAIFREVLAVRTIGTEDNFFDLGGDSVLASQVMARVFASTGVKLQILIFFESPTIAAIAAAIDAKQSAMADGTDAEADELEKLLADVESMTDEEVQAMLAMETNRSTA